MNTIYNSIWIVIYIYAMLPLLFSLVNSRVELEHALSLFQYKMSLNEALISNTR